MRSYYTFRDTLRQIMLLSVIAIAVLLWNYLSTSFSHQNLSVIVQAYAKREKSLAQNSLLQPRGESSYAFDNKSGEPSPLDRLSSEELKRFPGGSLVEAAEVAGPALGETTRVRILKTNFKFPYIRTEEIINDTTGELVGREEMVADNLLLSLQEGQDPQDILDELGSDALSMEQVTPYDPSLYSLNLASPSLESIPAVLDRFADEGKISPTAEPNFVRSIPAGNQIGESFLMPSNFTICGTQYPWDAKSNRPFATHSGTSSVVIAVIDTGVRPTHKDLSNNLWVNPHPMFGDLHGINALEPTYNGNVDDDEGHGTFCAGVVLAVNPSVKIMACKALDYNGVGTDLSEVACIAYACAHGTDILSCSWGGAGDSKILRQALQKARLQGTICVTGAGNGDPVHNIGYDIDKIPFYPASYDRTDDPKRLDNVVAVGATAAPGDLASFSNYGEKSVPVVAPGVNIISLSSVSDDGYAQGSGTSMAAPYVAGTLALEKEKNPTKNYTSLISTIQRTSDKFSGLAGKITSGQVNVAKTLSEAGN